MVIILMGVAGAGKTTIGRRLADELGWTFYDADDFHPPPNVEKMASGIPLTDDDRWAWLESLKALIDESLRENVSVVIACSALKASYRRVLVRDEERVQIVYLKGTPELIQRRIEARAGHFFDAALLASQFDALEEPGDALIVDVAPAPDVIVETIVQALDLDEAR